VPGNAVSFVLFARWTPPRAGGVLLLRWPPQSVSRRARASDQACLRPEHRPPPVTDLVSRPSSHPCAQAGNDAP
jgi:hypothetical protein